MNPGDFRDPALARQLLDGIRRLSGRTGPVRLMEVCGTHTMEIGRLGLRALLPEGVSPVSGPGCPVCVTPAGVIDAAAELSRREGVTVLTFGDMIRVPGSRTSLQIARSQGGRVEVVASPLQAVASAAEAPDRDFVFVAVGFETTTPAVARAIEIAEERGLANLSFLVAHRLVPPALDVLCADPELGIAGFLLPGHVSAIIGLDAYAGLVGRGIPAAVTGFEPLDILAGIAAVLEMLAEGTPSVVNMYPRIVRTAGNPAARALVDRYFEPVDAEWRGIGVLPGSGLALREAYAHRDAARTHGVPIAGDAMPGACSCGDVLRGKIRPNACPLFGGVCTPSSPVGPCMVSSEGSCAAYYRYERAI